ncbi:MAG: hypothetical protein ACI3YB_06445 [Prevotella sp.]
MKRFKFYMTMTVFACMAFAMTSCEEDRWDWDYYDYYEDWYDDYDWYDDAFNYGTDNLNRMASTLRGHWEGTMRNVFTNDNGIRDYVDMNVHFEFDQYNSRSLNGRGRETDWIGDEYQELLFSWYIDPRTGNICIRYDNSGYTFLLNAHTNAEDSGFSLSDKYFEGVMEGVNNTELIFFECERTTIYRQGAAAAKKSKVKGKTGKYAEKPMFRKR